MKRKSWFYPFLLTGMCLMLSYSCKKDEKENNNNPNENLPVLTTSIVGDITQTTASCGGNITSDGGATITARGVCWSIEQYPTIADSKTTDGTGTGSFTSSIHFLNDSTKYYIRAYATNSYGTGYGDTKSFTTLPFGGVSLEPSMNFTGGEGFVTADITLGVGELFYVGLNASSNTISKAKLTNLKIVRTINNIPQTVIDTTFQTDNFNIQFAAMAYPAVGSERWTFTLTDKSGESKELAFVITTILMAGEINTYTSVMLGGQLNPNLGGFYATFDNVVLIDANADLHQIKIDMVYYYGATNHASIIAPASSQIALIPEYSYILDAGNANHWTVTNQTKFKDVTPAGIDWSLVSNDALIIANATNLTDMNVNQLAVNDIIAFETAATSVNPGKKGLFKVTAIDGNSASDRSITIEVKIQK
jgi:hypothetical protein